jgi:hypothetical protein
MSIGVAEWADGMKKEVTGCSRGGVSAYTNWIYQYVFSLLLKICSSM